MAVTKIWDIKGRLDRSMDYVMNPDKTKNPKYDEGYLQTLGDVIEYAMDEDKTEHHFFVSGINCNTSCARRQFVNVKKEFDKEDGIIAFHGYQSFLPGETTPEEAHRIGLELAEELWGDRFQVIVSTHLNTKCLHNHFLLNSVSFKDGRKYHDCLDSYKKLREVSDRICREHGLSVIENPRKSKTQTRLYRKEKAGMPTRYNLAKSAIDEAITESKNLRELAIRLKEMGYDSQFNPRRKYWTVTPKGYSKPIRMSGFGEEYTNDRILERLLENQRRIKSAPFQKARPKGRQYLLITRKDRINKVGGLRGLYLKYCYQLGYLPKYKQNPNRVHYLLKAELMQCEKYAKQVRLLGKHHIETKEDLKDFLSKREADMKTFTEERAELRKKARRVLPEEKVAELKAQINALTEELKTARQEIKLCKDIGIRSDKFKEKLERIEAEQEAKKEKPEKNR